MSSGQTPAPASGGQRFVPPTAEHLDEVLEQYEVIELLGVGGMGAVYKARQPSLDRIVAIKILPFRDDPKDDGFRYGDRFRREARAMAKLNHPNILTVHDFGKTSDGYLFIVMEFVEGTHLNSLIKNESLPIEMFLKLLPQICDALEYAHSRGVIHRDIKPANILIKKDGTAKVADFGLVKLADHPELEEADLSLTNVPLGTPNYMSPEAIEGGQPVDHRADIYALGVMIYQCLTGKLPRGAWEPPSRESPGVDELFDEVVNRAMQSDPDSRFQHAADISNSLSHIAGVVPVSRRAFDPRALVEADWAGGSKPPFPGRRKGLLILIGASAVVIAVCLFLWPGISGPPGFTGEVVPDSALLGPGPLLGDLTLRPGIHQLSGHHVTLGDRSLGEKNKRPGNISIPGGVEVSGGELYLDIGTLDANFSRFENMDICANLHGRLVAQNSLFDNCSFRKQGGWLVNLYSARFTFENCVLNRQFFTRWSSHHVGVHIRNCTFDGIDFAMMSYKKDAGEEAVSEWRTIANCHFIGCHVPASVLIATTDCLFENCTFGEPEDMPGETPVTTTIYLVGDSAEPVKTGPGRTISVAPADQPAPGAGADLVYVLDTEGLRFVKW